MSSEVENNTEEEKKTEPKRPLKRIILDQWQIGLKLLELALAAVCIGFVYEPLEKTAMKEDNFGIIGLMFTTYAGSMAIIGVLLLGRVLKDRLGFKTSFIFSVTNSALFFTTGVLLNTIKGSLTKNEFYHPRRYLLNMMVTSIVVAFLNGIVFFVDAAVTFKFRKDF